MFRPCLNNVIKTNIYSLMLYNPLDSFCYAGDNKVYELCGVGKKEYDRATQICEGGVVKTECGAAWYDPSNPFPFNAAYRQQSSIPLGHLSFPFILHHLRFNNLGFGCIAAFNRNYRFAIDHHVLGDAP